MASREEPQENISPTKDHAGVRQQSDMLLFKGSQHITPLPVSTKPQHHGEEPPEDTSPATDTVDVRQQPDMLLFKESQHITPQPVSTVNKECIFRYSKSPHVQSTGHLGRSPEVALVDKWILI
ncbi:uncharacterized protein LOC135102787 [Scylla paramamosain]|uniref:uncharacterized protein LOC135102787 n=1 Tax=Scylla paramamosain TaxID=85552 RepID=UPI003083A103